MLQYIGERGEPIARPFCLFIVKTKLQKFNDFNQQNGSANLESIVRRQVVINIWNRDSI